LVLKIIMVRWILRWLVADKESLLSNSM